MRLPALLAGICLIAISPVTPAAAATYIATLTGAAEVPQRVTPGTGNITVTIDGDMISMVGSFADLLATTSAGAPSATTAAHIHCCTSVTGTAGVATQVPSLPGFPLGVRSGMFDSGLFDLTLTSSYNPAFINANGGTAAGARNALITGLNAGLAYFNVHSNAFPGGEIRGQLVPVPEPATWATMILGFGLIGAAMRRQRSRGRAAIA